MIVSSTRWVKIALFLLFLLELSFLSFYSVWVQISLFFSKEASSDSPIFPCLCSLTGQEWHRGPVCWVGFKSSLLYPSSVSSTSSPLSSDSPISQFSFTYPRFIWIQLHWEHLTRVSEFRFIYHSSVSSPQGRVKRQLKSLTYFVDSDNQYQIVKLAFKNPKTLF